MHYIDSSHNDTHISQPTVTSDGKKICRKEIEDRGEECKINGRKMYEGETERETFGGIFSAA